MKKSSLIVLLCLVGLASYAQYGYKIKVEFKEDIPDDKVYLAKYFAKGPPTIYRIDSANVTNKRTAVFDSKDSVLGGMYMILFDKNSKYAEVVMDNGLNTEMTITPSQLPTGVSFKNSEENAHYAAYQKDADVYGKQFQQLNKELETAKTEADSQAIRKEYRKTQQEFNKIRKEYIAKYPTSFVATVFKALERPEVPEGKHYLEDGKTVDSMYAFNYMKAHYWDDFNFNDNRLIHTPIYDGRLNDYFSNYVYPIPDSFNAEADKLLAKTRNAKELFKYTLHFLAGYTEQNKVMGMDESFVHIVENYYMKGDAYWLDSAQVAKYIDRAQKIAPNVLGNPAPALHLKEINTLQDVTLDSIKAPYTVLVFWAYDCGHCQKEIPQLDSLYEKELKKRGVKIMTVGTKGTMDDIKEFVKKYKMEHWLNTVEPNANTYQKLYDVYSTPKMYLLDENNIIRGKGLTPETVLKVLEFDEKRKSKESGSKKG